MTMRRHRGKCILPEALAKSCRLQALIGQNAMRCMARSPEPACDSHFDRGFVHDATENALGPTARRDRGTTLANTTAYLSARRCMNPIRLTATRRAFLKVHVSGTL